MANENLNEIVNLIEIKDFDSAEEKLKSIIFFESKNTKALELLAYVYNEKGNYDFALNLLERIAIMEPENSAVLNLAGVILGKQNKHSEAEKYFRRALKLAPNSKDIIKNLALALQSQNKIDEAVQKYKQLLTEFPSDPIVYNDFGYLLQNICLYDDAKECFRRAILLKEDFALAHWNLATILLREKDLENGFEEYELGFLAKQRTDRRFSKPKWDGKYIEKNKKLLVSHEQGFGDSIFFSRYLQYLIEKEINFILEVPQELYFLYKNIDGIDDVIVMDKSGKEPLIDYDYYIPIGSLPYVLKKFSTQDIPQPLKFNFQQDDNKEEYKAGICWKGSEKHRADLYRSISIEKFEDFFNQKSIEFVALSKNISQEEGIYLFKHRVNTDIQLSKDFLSTAYILQELDLIITVDTAVAHLAASMGKAVWLLLQYNSDWRWFNDERITPWYNNCKIYKQKLFEPWEQVLDRVYNDFKKIFGIV
jgi:Tfp pilus assembly protein PilF